MKKLVILFASIFMLGLASCNKPAVNAEAATEDSIVVVDSVIVDTAAVDSVAL